MMKRGTYSLWLGLRGALVTGLFGFLAVSHSGCGTGERELPAEAPQPEVEEGTGYLGVRVLYAEDGPEADDARIRVETAVGDEVARPTRRSEFELDAGTYRVTAILGEATATVDAVVRADERVEVTVDMNAGVLQLDAQLAEDGPGAPEARFSILAAEPDIRGQHETLVRATRRNQFTLPAGTYLAEAREGDAAAQIEVEVSAGERSAGTVILQAGRVHATVVDAEGQDVTDHARWAILSAEKDLQGRRETLVHPARRNQFVLSAGAYIAEVRVGDLTEQKAFEVVAGERTDLVVEGLGAEQAD